MTEHDDEFGEPLPHDSRSVAKDIAEANGFAHLWESYHPVVKATLEWLNEHNYLTIVIPTQEPPMKRDDLRKLVQDPRWDDTLEPVTDEELAELGYVRVESVPGVELDGPAGEWVSIPADQIDVDDLREAVVRHHLLHRHDLADYLHPDSPIFVVAVQVLAALTPEDAAT